MTILQMQPTHPCPECGIGVLKDQLVTYSFPYRSTTISCQHMALVCQNPKCMMIICDYRAESAQERAIRYYELGEHDHKNQQDQ